MKAGLPFEERAKFQVKGGAEKIWGVYKQNPMHACLCLPQSYKHHDGKNFICLLCSEIIYPPLTIVPGNGLIQIFVE